MAQRGEAGVDGTASDALLALGRFFTRWEESSDGRAAFLKGGRAGGIFYRDRWSHDKVVPSLLQLKLLDELNLLEYPVIVGRGKRLAEGDGENLPLELVKSTAFDNGVIHQLYRPAP